ncbi:MAG: hypothetical protein Q9227_004089 [Pyrenula ochraceoflavens]
MSPVLHKFPTGGPPERARVLPSPHSTDTSNATPSPAISNAETPPIAASAVSSGRHSLPVNRTPGFLGSTSYAAVFDESQERIVTETLPKPTLPDRTIAIEADDLDMVGAGARMLDRLCELVQPITETPPTHKCLAELTFLAPVIYDCANALQDLITKLAALPQNDRDLIGVSKDIFQNTSKPYTPADITSPRKMSDFFTIQGLRWEAVALGCCAYGPSTLLSTNKGAASYNLGPGKGTITPMLFARAMVSSAASCLDFCDELGNLNEMYMWALYENALITSFVYGDSHYLTWRRLGDVSTAVFAMGLHQEIKVSKDIPFFISEVRKNTFSRAFYTDKELGTFLGRPPRISQRYCKIQMPLDLTIDEMGFEGAELEAALAKLDRNGWNTEERCGGTTWNRAMLTSSMYREEILELSLGLVDESTIESRATDIMQRQEESWAELPQHFRNWKRQALPWVKGVLGYLYLDRLYNVFLLQRTVVKFFRVSAKDMLDTARHMLNVILEIVHIYIQPGNPTGDMAWTHQQQYLPLHKRTYQPERSFPRSEIVQNLSVLVSHIAWIYKEGEGNYDLCKKAQRVIQGILDHVLSPPDPEISQSSMARADEQEMVTDEGFQPMETSVLNPGDMDQNLVWFDNNYFDNDFWMNLAGHPLLTIPDLPQDNNRS